MGSGTVPPDLLVKPTELSRYNVPADFLAQFAPQPFSVKIATPGALGVMAFVWQRPGDTAWSPAIVSDAGASWLYTIEENYCDLTLAAFAYVANTVYAIDRRGVVTGGAGELAVSRFDPRLTACTAATREAMKLMRDAISPPLTAWDDDATTHAAAIAYAILKRGKGATPAKVEGTGDANIFTAEKRALDYFADIGKNGRPDSMTDTSPSTDGPLIPVYPYGDCRRGF